MSVFFMLLLYGTLFLGIMLAVDAAFGLTKGTSGTDDPAIKRRLDAVRRVALEEDRTGISIRRTIDDIPAWGEYIPFYRYIARLIRESGDKTTVARILMVMGVVFVAVLVGLSFGARFIPFPLRPVIAAIVAIVPVVLSLKMGCGARRRKFEEQLPDALELVVRSLKVGHPMASAMKVVASELPDPLGTEFRVAVEQVTYGDEIAQAFEKMSARMPAPDLAFLTAALQIHHESGGNLAEILGKLAAVIRDRFRMFRKVKAITAEARFSAWFLSLFPLAIIGFIQLVKPDYYTQVADFPFFPHLVALTFVLLVVNVIAMKVMTKISV